MVAFVPPSGNDPPFLATWPMDYKRKSFYTVHTYTKVMGVCKMRTGYLWMADGKMQIEKKLRRTKGENVDGKNKQKRKEQQHIHVQNAVSMQSRTQSPVMCFWGERRLGLLSITSVCLRRRFFAVFRSFPPFIL